MIIERIRMERFRLFRKFSAELGPGLVVVRGANESGKSTLMDALVTALYVKPGSAGAELKSNTSWGEETLPAVVLDLTLDGVPARLEKDFARKKVRITHADHEITAARAAEEWIISRLGCPTQAMFKATACAAEMEIEIPRMQMSNSCSREIVARLQAMLTGGPGGSPAQVIQKLEKRAREIRKNPGAGDPEGGPAVSFRRRLEETRRKLHELRKDLNASDLASAGLEKARSREAELARELSAVRAAVGNHRLCREAEKNMEIIAERLNRLARAEERMAELRELEKSLSAYPGYENLGGEAERLQGVKNEREALDQRLTEISRRKYDSELKMPRSFAALLVSAALAVIAGSMAAAVFRNIWPAGLGALAAAGLAAAGFAVRSRAVKRERARMAAFDSEIKAAEADVARIEAETNGIVKKFGKVSVDDCLRAYQEFLALAPKAGTVKQAVADLAGPTPLRELSARIAALTLELRVEKDRVRELEPYKISDPVRFAGLEQEAARKEDELMELAAKKSEAEARLLAADFDPGELAALEEEEAELRKWTDYWERQLRVHDKSLSVLRESVQAVMEKAGLVIQEEIAPIVKRITAARYDEVRADDDLSLSLFSRERGDWVCEDELSLATREQLHLAARLALVRLITEERRPPILLDDPFAHFDDERLAASMAVLKEFSSTYQIIIFSPTGRYDAHADRVVRLDDSDGY
ncbi:MAG TPA: AAA family ATPase [bacterium]|nr:AAA family ATPase [bacterium]